MKVRTQIQLEEEQYRQLKILASRERISLTEALRRILARLLLESTVPGRRKPWPPSGW